MANVLSEPIDTNFCIINLLFDAFFTRDLCCQISIACHITNAQKRKKSTIEIGDDDFSAEYTKYTAWNVFVYVSGGSQNESFDNDDVQGDCNSHIIRIRGLPWNTTKQEICDFFDGVNIVNGENGIHWVTLATNHTKPLSEAYIELASFDDLQRAQTFHKKNLGTRYIEGKFNSWEDCTIFMFVPTK